MKKIIPVFILPFVLIVLGFVPSGEGKSYNMFHIGRSRDENIIKYDVNLTSEGKINADKPIKVYWVKKNEGGKVVSLSYIQNKLAYGITYLSKGESEVKFQFVSHDKRTFYVRKTKGSIYKTTTYINSKSVEVKKIFIQIDGGSFMVPKISYVKLYWRDPISGVEDIETIKP